MEVIADTENSDTRQQISLNIFSTRSRVVISEVLKTLAVNLLLLELVNMALFRYKSNEEDCAYYEFNLLSIRAYQLIYIVGDAWTVIQKLVSNIQNAWL